MTRFLSLWLLAGICQYPFLEAFLFFDDALLNERFSLVLALYFVSLVFLFVAVPKDRGWFHAQRLWGRTSLGFFSWFPVLGWLSLLGYYLFVRYHTGSVAQPADDEFLLSRPLLSGLEANPLLRRDRLIEEMDLMPLADILAGHDLALKRGAIEKLAEIRTPEAIAFLLEYRSDEAPEVRFFITSALTRIKSEYEEQINAAKKDLQKDMYRWESRFLLGRIYFQYTRAGLLDENTRDQFEKEAVFHLTNVVNAGVILEDAATLLLKLFQGRREWAGMSELLELIEAKSSLPESILQQWKAEVHFEQAEYVLLQEDLRRLSRQNKVLSSEWLTQINWWSAS